MWNVDLRVMVPKVVSVNGLTTERFDHIKLYGTGFNSFKSSSYGIPKSL